MLISQDWMLHHRGTVINIRNGDGVLLPDAMQIWKPLRNWATPSHRLKRKTRNFDVHLKRWGARR
jgi:hypothetical protein